MSSGHDQGEPTCQEPECQAEPLTGNYFVATYPPFSCWTEASLAELEERLEKPSARDRARQPALGLYVHIPFCAERCSYCYYRSYDSFSAPVLSEYVDALGAELGRYTETPLLRDRRLEFVYFGGGTPSLLSADEIGRLTKSLERHFPWDDVREVTFESAPKTVSSRKMETLRQAGVTRLSLGVQILDDPILELNGRIHLTHDVLRAYETIRQAGFATVNVDLIVGLVGETDEAFFGSLERVIGLRPDSVTIYQLELPRNTPLCQALDAGRLASELAGWNVKRRRLGEAFTRLEHAGYTIATAYAALSDPDRHRFVYQQSQYRGADLLGLGCSSFSYLDGIHFQNRSSLEKYRRAIAAGRYPWARAHVLNPQEQAVREFVLQLKLGRVDPTAITEKYGFDILAACADAFAAEVRTGSMTVDRGAVALTREGLLRADHVLRQFYLPEHRTASYW
jgi:oxygen-independent coproporphyrinogen-3 oxidase